MVKLEPWRPVSAIFLFNKSGMITVVNAILMLIHSNLLENELGLAMYLKTLMLGLCGIGTLGWWMHLTHLGDALAFFILTLWCTRHSQEHITEFKGFPLPPWSIPWVAIGFFNLVTMTSHPAWEEACGAAVAYSLELWRRRKHVVRPTRMNIPLVFTVVG